MLIRFHYLHVYRSNKSKDRIEIFSSQTDESTGSADVVNTVYYRPQPSKEAQIREPEYSYAAVAGDANVYDSVMEQSRGDTYNENYAKPTPGAVNSTDVPQGAYYSVCENGQVNDMYSKLARK